MPWNQDGLSSPRIDSVLEHNSLWLMSVSKNPLYNIVRSSFFVFSFIGLATSVPELLISVFSPWLWWCREAWIHLNKTTRYFFFLAPSVSPELAVQKNLWFRMHPARQLPLLLSCTHVSQGQEQQPCMVWWRPLVLLLVTGAGEHGPDGKPCAICTLRSLRMDSALERSWSCCGLVAYSFVLLLGPRVSSVCRSASGTADIPSPQAANTPVHDPRINPLLL
jgi:hypothetical protein